MDVYFSVASTMFKASKWAFGHSITLILFGALAIIFQKSLQVFISDLAFWAELSIGPIMVWLGIVAIRRNHEINRKLKEHKKIKHEGVRYSCDKCDYSATERRCINRHKQKKH